MGIRFNILMRLIKEMIQTEEYLNISGVGLCKDRRTWVLVAERKIVRRNDNVYR